MMVGLKVHGLDAFVGCSTPALVMEREEKLILQNWARQRRAGRVR